MPQILIVFVVTFGWYTFAVLQRVTTEGNDVCNEGPSVLAVKWYRKVHINLSATREHRYT
jgi:hypothetical protein